MILKEHLKDLKEAPCCAKIYISIYSVPNTSISGKAILFDDDTTFVATERDETSKEEGERTPKKKNTKGREDLQLRIQLTNKRT